MATPVNSQEETPDIPARGPWRWFDRLMEITPARHPSRIGQASGYAVAVVLVLIALGARMLLGPPELGLQFVTFFPAVALAAIYGGFWPGMLAASLSIFLATYLYIPPFHEFSFEFATSTLMSNLAFVADELMVCGAIQAMHNHHRRSRAASERLAKNRNLLNAIVEGTTDAIFLKDTQGRYIYCNQAHLQLLGRELHELAGRSVFEVFPEAQARAMMEEDRHVFATRSSETTEQVVKLPDGKLRSYLTTKGPFFDDAGNIAGLFGVSHDITARKEAEQLLQNQHDRLEQEVKQRTDELMRSNATLASSLDSLAASIKEIDDLYQNAPCGYHSIDGDTVFVRINDTELSWLGYTREELVGKKRLSDVLTPASAARFKAEFPRMKQLGVLQGAEIEFVRKDGSVLLALVNVSAVRDERGEFVMSRAAVYDITERKRAEDTLLFHSEILNNLSEGVFLIRASDGKIVFTNPSFDRMFGYAAGELLGQPVSVINEARGRDPEEVAREILGELQRHGTWEGDVRNARKDGTAFWCHAHVTEFDHPQHGRVWISMHDDITARKEGEINEQKLNRALKLLSECNSVLIHAEEEQKLLDSICRLVVNTGGYVMSWVGFAMLNEDKTILPVATSGKMVEQYVRDNPITWADTELGRGPGGTAIRTRTTQVNQDAAVSPNFAPWRRAVAKAGYRSVISLPLLIEGAAIGALNIYAADPNAFVPDEIKLLEELAANIAFGIDALRVRTIKAAAEKELTRHRRNLEGLIAERTNELTRTKREAERANNAKSRFLAAASHDLRQPLSALKLYAGVLKGKLGAEDQALLTSMDECVASLSGLLSKLLDLSKLEAGVVTPRISEFSLDDMLNKVLASYAPEAETKGLTLRCGVFGLAARTDPVLFQRIVGNLVDNAIHYTKRGGVLIVCRRHEGRRWIEVWDTGIGIPHDKTAEIFEEFKQLGDDARTQGSGLGLTIVAKTAALLNLQIRVRSRVGHGSMFAIELPLGRVQHLVAPARPKVLRPGLRIAVVDDNPFVLNALTFSMEHAGHKVVAAESGRRLIAELGGSAPDVMVCDYRLAQGETGFDVITAVRAAFGRELPAIIITGDTDPDLMRSMADQGIVIQHKPVEFEDLQLRIEEVLRATSPA